MTENIQVANELASLFKPDDIKVKLNDEEYRLVYDLNALCELEKQYPSVDHVLQMLLGTPETGNLGKVTYQGDTLDPEEVFIGDNTLAEYIMKNETADKAKHSDTLNLLHAGLLHDHTTFNEDGEVTGYTISKAKVGSMVTFKNLREVNAQIVMAILRDLLPPQDEESKNEEAPATPKLVAPKTEE